MEKIGKKLKAREEEIEREERLESGEGSSSIQETLAQNKNILLGVAAAILLIAIGIGGWNFLQSRKDNRAGADMYQAVYYFEAENYQFALEGDTLSPRSMGFLDIISEYDGTSSANRARYYAGVIYLKQGDAAQAIDYLKDVDKGDNMMSVGAYMSLGFAHEEQEDLETAASYFEKAANAVKDNDQTTPFALLHAGQAYELAGNKEKALKAFSRIKEDFPTSTEGQTIDKYIGRVSP